MARASPRCSRPAALWPAGGLRDPLVQVPPQLQGTTAQLDRAVEVAAPAEGLGHVVEDPRLHVDEAEGVRDGKRLFEEGDRAVEIAAVHVDVGDVASRDRLS